MKIICQQLDEYAQGRRLGLIDDALHQRVDAARQQVIALIESRQGPFADDWSSWKRDPACQHPCFPRACPPGEQANAA